MSAPLKGVTANIGNVVTGERALQIEAMQAAAEVRNIYGGAVIDVLDFVVSNLVDAAEAHGIDIYTQLSPQIRGVPVWRIIRAGRNNHHHWLDWREANPPTKQQRFNLNTTQVKPLTDNDATTELSLQA